MDERGPHDGSTDTPDDMLVDIVQQAEAAPSSRERAFEILFERYHARVYRWCVQVLGDATRGEDVTQGIFLDIWQGRKPYQGQGRFGAWLYVLCRNRCLNALRSDRRRPDAEWDEGLAEMLVARSDPHAELEQAEFERRVDDVCQKRLNAKEQQVVVLRYRWGMKLEDITRTLELTNASGARTHLRSAETKLRRYLQALRRETDGGDR